MADANIEFARRMIERAREPNVVQQRVEVDNLRRRRAVWRPLRGSQIPFPRLSLDNLRDLTYGTYQVKLAPSYVQDKIQHEDDEEFQLDELTDEVGLLRVLVYSRFRNHTKYEIFVAFTLEPEENINENPENEIIESYYCTCKSGARTLGSCAHVASVLWYLGYARHEQNIYYPSSSLLHTVEDAGHRPPQINPNDPRIIEG